MSDNTSPSNPSRRRLAKGGVAASVILGSIASKNALAAPYLCTPSGKMSGNMSPGGRDGVNCSQLGQSCTYWKSQCSSSGPHRNKKFIDCFGNTSDCNIYKGRSSGNTHYLGSKSASGGTWDDPSKCYHVLAYTTTSASPWDPTFARAAMCAWFNAGVTSDYPITQDECKTMFKAVKGNYTVNVSGVDMSASDCRAFLMMLYRA